MCVCVCVRTLVGLQVRAQGQKKRGGLVSESVAWTWTGLLPASYYRRTCIVNKPIIAYLLLATAITTQVN